jgi:hypothetical protein
VKLLFDFVEVEDVAPELAGQPDDRLIKWLKARSLSFAETKFEAAITESNKRKFKAHTSCRTFASHLQ